ncbi:hypothetical protein [Hydrotalea sp.]|uniref:hypothetical protein n=1 Tax=Hydrotalea sp. TaxID=2881279 RepID=UPI00258E8099|nr:hypothetical protein [Hydrotalea sp.]
MRKKRNNSGTVSVQIIDKSSGRYVVHQTVGSSADTLEIDFLVKKANHIIRTYGGQRVIAFSQSSGAAIGISICKWFK